MLHLCFLLSFGAAILSIAIANYHIFIILTIIMPLIPPSDDVLDRYPVLVFEEIHSSAPSQIVKTTPKVLCHPDRVHHIKGWHIVYPAVAQLYATTDAHKASCSVFSFFFSKWLISLSA